MKPIEKELILLAKFLGMPKRTIRIQTQYRDIILRGYKFKDLSGYTHTSALAFNTSWDWLMSVIDKIERLYETETRLPRFEINSHNCHFSGGGFNGVVGCYMDSPEKIKAPDKITAAFMLVVMFIKWYNKNK